MEHAGTNAQSRYAKPTNVNNVKPNRKRITLNNVRDIAHRLVESYNEPQSYDFFCKVAWYLSEGDIWSTHEKSFEKNNPAAWFSRVCKIKMEQR